MSEVEEAMIVEVKRNRQQKRHIKEQESFNPEQFGLNLKSLEALKNAVLDAPLMDFLRIEQVKQEIADGKFYISNEGIAAKMMGIC